MMRFAIVCVLAFTLIPAVLRAAEDALPNPLCPVLPTEPAIREHHIEHDGRTIYFCCESCVEKFRANPAAYLAQLPAPPIVPTVSAADHAWHWWTIFDYLESVTLLMTDHPILMSGLGVVLVLALMTRVRRRVSKGVYEPARAAHCARVVLQPFPVVLAVLALLAVDLALTEYPRDAVLVFVGRHRIPVIGVVVVALLGSVAHIITRANSQPDRRLGRFLARIGHPGTVFTLILLGTSWVLGQEIQTARRVAAQSQARVQELDVALQSAQPALLGWAWPQGLHQLPQGIHNTYYRGNDERSEKLFNNGNYRTATFQVSLCRESGERVEIGQKLGEVPLMIRWTIDRGPKTADNFFSKAMMEKCFITDGYGEDAHTVSATITETDRVWRMDMPIREARLSGYQGVRGVFYCCLANGPARSLATAIVHYYVQYTLHFQDGVLLPGSTVWMVPVYPSPILHGPDADGEWFSDRPIPEITGENTRDPKLLGVPGAQ